MVLETFFAAFYLPVIIDSHQQNVPLIVLQPVRIVLATFSSSIFQVAFRISCGKEKL